MNNENKSNQNPRGQQQDQQDQQRLREQQQQRQGGGGKVDAGQIRQHMEVVGSDGARIGTVDKVEGDRIKLTKDSSGGSHGDHHHYIDCASVAAIEGNKVRLSTAGSGAAIKEKGGESVDRNR
jgi:hypothetical protein